MISNISVNYGLKGGTLDATKHVEKAIPILMTGGERGLHCTLTKEIMDAKPRQDLKNPGEELMKWRTFYRDNDVNGEGVIPALQVAVPSDIDADDHVEAAQKAASCHPFEGSKEFVCVPANQIHYVTLQRDHYYKEIPNNSGDNE